MKRANAAMILALLALLLAMLACISASDTSVQTAPQPEIPAESANPVPDDSDGGSAIAWVVAFFVWLFITVLLFILNPSMAYWWIRLTIEILTLGLSSKITGGTGNSSKSGRGGGRSGRGN